VTLSLYTVTAYKKLQPHITHSSCQFCKATLRAMLGTGGEARPSLSRVAPRFVVWALRLLGAQQRTPSRRPRRLGPRGLYAVHPAVTPRVQARGICSVRRSPPSARAGRRNCSPPPARGESRGRHSLRGSAEAAVASLPLLRHGASLHSISHTPTPPSTPFDADLQRCAPYRPYTSASLSDLTRPKPPQVCTALKGYLSQDREAQRTRAPLSILTVDIRELTGLLLCSQTINLDERDPP